MSARCTSLLLLLLLGACGCPPLAPSYTTPLATLETFQAQLCREDQEGEYSCLSESFKRGIGGFENYYAARELMLERTPLGASSVFKRIDLANNVTAQTLSPDGLAAELVMEFLVGDPVSIYFERETLATLAFEDGSLTGGIQDAPMSELVGSEAGRNWVLFDAPLLTSERLRGLTNVTLSSRWHISGLTGFVPGASVTQP